MASRARTLTISLIAAVTVAALLALASVYASSTAPRIFFSGVPVVEFGGRITDAQSGKGVSDAFVVVNVTSFQLVPFVGHGYSGCVPGSAVLTTDADGRYHFRWSWKEAGLAIPNDLSVALKIYKPGWEHFPILRPHMGWESASRQRDFQLVPDTSTFEQRSDWWRRLIDGNCQYGAGRETFVPMYRAIYEEVWGRYCGPTADEHSLGFDLYWSKVEGTLAGMLHLERQAFAPSATSTAGMDKLQAIKRQVRAQVPDYPWPDYYTGPPMAAPRDLMPDEKSVLCRFLDPQYVDQRVGEGSMP
jgi:hypothetical protein